MMTFSSTLRILRIYLKECSCRVESHSGNYFIIILGIRISATFFFLLLRKSVFSNKGLLFVYLVKLCVPLCEKPSDSKSNANANASYNNKVVLFESIMRRKQSTEEGTIRIDEAFT